MSPFWRILKTRNSFHYVEYIIGHIQCLVLGKVVQTGTLTVVILWWNKVGPSYTQNMLSVASGADESPFGEQRGWWGMGRLLSEQVAWPV